MFRTLLVLSATTALILTSVSTVPAAEQSVSVLFLGGSSGSHRTAEMASLVIPPLRDVGVTVKYSEDVASLSKESLAKFDVVVIYRDHGALTPEHEGSLLEAIDGGKGLVAIHCASHCFRNSERYTKLIGGRFASHEVASFRPRIIDAQHAAIAGLSSFDTRDETYVHNELAEDIEVLMTREDSGRYEPYSWVRKQGKGRVYYTALGHDEQTWRQSEFQKEIERAIRWAAGLISDSDPPIVVKDEKPLPLTPVDSMKHMHLPEGFRVELFAAEPEITKPIAMTFDGLGRLWILESIDYPNDILPEGKGNDRIKICEDTDGDGNADKFTVFADKLNIPTSLLCYGDGVLVADAPYILHLRDTNGDGRADERKVLFDGFGNADTHATHANLRYGLDNWIWATIGYSGAKIRIGNKTQVVSAGVFRFKPDGSSLEYLAPTQSNTWGLGFNSQGDAFVSKANDDHSLHFAVANRYYEGVRGWHGVGIASIADHKHFHPIADDIRQVDWHGGYTAAAGCTVLNSDRLPPEYRDRAALVCEPTGHLVHVDFLVPDGSSFTARDGFNLLASTDPWTAPIETQIGPDGVVWMIDWYNYIVRHNPTPPGFKTGAGNAYITPDRDHFHGRIYRIIHESGPANHVVAHSKKSQEELIEELGSLNPWSRLTAQRLLVENHHTASLEKLATLASDQKAPLAALHALYTMDGLGAFDGKQEQWLGTLQQSLEHSDPGVRRAALQLLPKDARSASWILASGCLEANEASIQLGALLALAEMPGSPDVANEILRLLSDPKVAKDRWLPAGAVAALAPNASSFLQDVAQKDGEPTELMLSTTRTIAEHYARGKPIDTVGTLLGHCSTGNFRIAAAVLLGLEKGWPTAAIPEQREFWETSLIQLVERLPVQDSAPAVSLARKWGAGERFEKLVAAMETRWTERLENEDLLEGDRLAAAEQLITLTPTAAMLARILDTVSPKTSPEYAAGIIAVLSKSEMPDAAAVVLHRWSRLTPAPRRATIAMLMTRAPWTEALLVAIDDGTIDRTDLAIDQTQRLLHHRDKGIAERAKSVLERQGGVVESNRQAVVDRLLPLASQHGDLARGKQVFEQNCAKCHRYGGIGQSIGPDLTGIAARKREDILTDVLDPNRSVEGNFRQYTVATSAGLVLTGLLLAESRTAIEVLDSEAKKHAVLREDIEEIVRSKLSVMPEGFEKLPEPDLVSLLDYLTTRGKYFPLPLGKAATIVSTRGMFYDKEAPEQRIIFDHWGPHEAFGVPFQLIDPREDQIPNAILLHGPLGAVSREMPKSARVPCNAPLKAIHLLSGISGWGYPASRADTVSMIVRLHFADGEVEEHPLLNGRHFADYIRVVDVPQSRLAFELHGRQLRYLVVSPRRKELVSEIEFLKGEDASAPLVMAITAESF